MITIGDIQSTVVDLIEAESYFAGKSVIEDLGKSQKEIEAALRSPGACIVVPPVLAGDLLTQTKGATISSIGLMVKILVNPNATLTGFDIYQAITQIVHAVLSYTAERGEKPFEIADNLFTLSHFDPGLLAYDLFFTKDCILK
ncbi:MAG: hypothetical protein M1608_17385 [Candidatus Omnitrophica bacterium]|nr:hypothetical protein [Candidatus Omnitrophota bacterium]